MKAILLVSMLLTLSACGMTIQHDPYGPGYNPIGDVMPAPLDCNTQTEVWQCG